MWWLGVSFGMRGFVDLMPVFALGFGTAFTLLEGRLEGRRGVVVAEVIALFFIVNLHLAVAFRGRCIWVDGPLYWTASVSEGAKYKAQLRLEWKTWTDCGPGSRLGLVSRQTE
jgi:hypothetical protein